jgi:two-component SAPR family response regulator
VRCGAHSDEKGATQPLPTLEAFALGTSEVRVDGRTIGAVEWRRRKSKELFFYMLCHPGWQRREQIVTDVWPEASKAGARSAFHTNAHYLRRSLHPDVLEMQEGRYRLNPAARCWLDADTFERLCDADGSKDGAGSAGTTKKTKRARLSEAVALYRGAFLEDLGPEWAEERRRHLETAYLQALIELGHEQVRYGAYDVAVRLAERALEIDPYLDTAHEVVMLAQMAAGQAAAALHHYTCHAERLRRELNGTPAPVLQALRQRLERAPVTAVAS